MKTVALMRHSQAVSNNPAYTDHERPLTESGRGLAKTTSRMLYEAGFCFDRVICSSAVRTMETASIVRAEFGGKPMMSSTDSLYLTGSSAYPAAAVDLDEDSEDSVILIGHNPGIGLLIQSWCNRDVFVSPATVAVFELDVDDWPELNQPKKLRPVLKALISGGVRQV